MNHKDHKQPTINPFEKIYKNGKPLLKIALKRLTGVFSTMDAEQITSLIPKILERDNNHLLLITKNEKMVNFLSKLEEKEYTILFRRAIEERLSIIFSSLPKKELIKFLKKYKYNEELIEDVIGMQGDIAYSSFASSIWCKFKYEGYEQ